MSSQNYTLKIPSQTYNLSIVRKFVADIAERVGFEKEDVANIQLAVDEACTNAIKHAYTDNGEQHFIQLRMKTDAVKLTIEIVDNGKGINTQELPDADVQRRVQQYRRGGLGIYLMNQLMDEVSFNVKPGKRTSVRMIKYINNPPASS